MMVAIDKHGKRYLATTCTKRQSLFCPACKEPVILKTGQQKTAHFAHKNLQDCFGFSEKETTEHLQLKKYFFEWCRQFVTHPPVLEAYLPALRQRPDILCGDLAIEIQCSVLAYERMKERTKDI
ncbi:competence protein CoiA [Enterococcus hirae]